MTVYTTFNPTSIFADGDDFQTRKATILTGQNVAGTPLPRGTLLGRSSVLSAASAAKSGGNTGNGTFVLDATNPLRAGVKPGVYTLRNITAGANTGTFRLTDPDGFLLGDYTITGGAGGTVTVDNDIKGVITDAATDFIVGDGFDITVAVSGKYKISVATAIDGSQIPRAVTADDLDTSGGDVVCRVYEEGTFNFEACQIDASWTIDALNAVLSDNSRDLYFRSGGAAA